MKKRTGIIAIHAACQQCGYPCLLGRKYCADCEKPKAKL